MFFFDISLDAIYSPINLLFFYLLTVCIISHKCVSKELIMRESKPPNHTHCEVILQFDTKMKRKLPLSGVWPGAGECFRLVLREKHPRTLCKIAIKLPFIV